MQKRIINQSIQETRQCLMCYWQNDYSYAVERLSKDIMWIGALETEFSQGKDDVTEDLVHTGTTNPRCHLLQQEFWCTAESGDMCVITGRYMVTTDEESGEIIQEPQRCTFVWKAHMEVLEIVHMHISSPVGYLEEHELFPHKIGKMTYQYLKELSGSYKEQERNLEISETNGHIRFLSEAEIEYAEARGHNTIITAANGLIITSRVKWADFQNMLIHDFVKVHRSFTVNRKYIRSIKGNEIEMVSGVRIPIPAKKRKEVCAKIKMKGNISHSR